MISDYCARGIGHNVLFQVELLELTQILLFRLPYSIHNVLDVQNEVGLTVSRVAEWHIRRIRLSNGRQRQMRRPGLYQDHVACDQACSIGPAPRVCSAPEYHSSVIVGWIAENLMELHGESVEVTDMQRPEVVVESIVQEGIIDREVDRWRTRG